jgi:opacity protein-like surface antigen
MKKFISVTIILLIEWQILYNQTVNSASHPITEIFTDFHLNLNDTSKTTGFALNRAYLGYNFTPEGHFSGAIIINAGKPDDLAPGSNPRIYAYFREASITWSDEKLKVSFGITGTHLFDFQQGFWGKRYIANTYQSINGFGFVADLGIAMVYQISDILKADLTIMNGEGYGNVQLDNSIRTATGLTITPNPHLAFRIYGDITRMDGLWQPMAIGFAGFKNEMMTIGAEITYKSNLDLIKGHHAWGFSGTGAVRVAEKTELFVRYDLSTSVLVPENNQKWNYLNDGSFLVMGIQYAFNENIKIALDYQGTHPYDNDLDRSDAVFVNALFKFGR